MSGFATVGGGSRSTTQVDGETSPALRQLIGTRYRNTLRTARGASPWERKVEGHHEDFFGSQNGHGKQHEGPKASDDGVQPATVVERQGHGVGGSTAGFSRGRVRRRAAFKRGQNEPTW